jgi:hypothetical protein
LSVDALEFTARRERQTTLLHINIIGETSGNVTVTDGAEHLNVAKRIENYLNNKNI